MKLYSYNQLLALHGQKDKQVKAIKKYLSGCLDCISNKTLEAFKRINNK